LESAASLLPLPSSLLTHALESGERRGDARERLTLKSACGENLQFTPPGTYSPEARCTLLSPRSGPALFLGVGERGDSREHLALEELERGAAARRDVLDLRRSD
jgi:hypothetical protein